MIKQSFLRDRYASKFVYIYVLYETNIIHALLSYVDYVIILSWFMR